MPSCRHVLVHVLVSVHDILAMVVYASCSLVSGSGAMVPHTVVYCVVTLRNALVYVCVCGFAGLPQFARMVHAFPRGRS